MAAKHQRRGNDAAVHSNDSSFAFWYAACGIPVDPAAGRAPIDAPTKPELEGTALDAPRLAAARGHVALLRRAAGLRDPLPATAGTAVRPTEPPCR